MIIRLFSLTTQLFLTQLLGCIFKSCYQLDIWLSVFWIQFAWNKQNGVQRVKRWRKSSTNSRCLRVTALASIQAAELHHCYFSSPWFLGLMAPISLIQNFDNNIILILIDVFKYCILDPWKPGCLSKFVGYQLFFFFFFHCESWVKSKAMRSQSSFRKKMLGLGNPVWFY